MQMRTGSNDRSVNSVRSASHNCHIARVSRPQFRSPAINRKWRRSLSYAERYYNAFITSSFTVTDVIARCFFCENASPFTAPCALRVCRRYSCLRCVCTSVDDLFRVTFEEETHVSHMLVHTHKCNFHEGCTRGEPSVNMYVSAPFRCQEPSFSVKPEVRGATFGLSLGGIIVAIIHRTVT